MANFFSTPKPRQFNVTPRYWNPEKEQREMRERRIKSELGISDNTDGKYTPYIAPGAFRQGLTRGKWGGTRSQRKSSNTRVLIILAILALLLFFMFK
ncbi:MAG: hypothetical protein KA807_10445 [Prolixibacteraceae bacterium]|nr:hypothetical protein [Prolixibacteraceae bacterium]